MRIEVRLRKEIQKVTGKDPFAKTRKREVVEARALYIHLLHNYHKKGCSEIGRIMNLNHATILHSIKNFDMYVRFNQQLESYLYQMLMNQKYDKLEMRKEYIKIKVDYLPEQDVMKLSEKVREMYEESIIVESKELLEEQEYDSIKQEFQAELEDKIHELHTNER